MHQWPRRRNIVKSLLDVPQSSNTFFHHLTYVPALTFFPATEEKYHVWNWTLSTVQWLVLEYPFGGWGKELWPDIVHLSGCPVVVLNNMAWWSANLPSWPRLLRTVSTSVVLFVFSQRSLRYHDMELDSQFKVGWLSWAKMFFSLRAKGWGQMRVLGGGH